MLIPLLQRERSIDDFIDQEEGCRLSSVLEDKASVSQEESLYTKELHKLVYRALFSLDEREQHIICNRFGLRGGKELTLEQIGKSLNLSRERVRQLEREAKTKLRENLARFQSQVRFTLA